MSEVERLQEIIKRLRKEISDLIKENELLKEKVIDLEIIKGLNDEKEKIR